MPQRKSKVVENLLLLALLTFGGWGAFTVYSDSGQEHEEDPYAMELPATQTFDAEETRNPKEQARTYLKIHGIKETGSPLQFEIEHFNEGAHYYLDFGNGDSRTMMDVSTSYTYNRAGLYQVKLKMTYRGKTAVLFSQELVIDDPGEQFKQLAGF